MTKTEQTKTEVQTPQVATLAGPWTHFHDMHSGGGLKTPWGHIFIQDTADIAAVIFQRLFDRDPNNTTCTCRGGDYSISEGETLAAATFFERGWGDHKDGVDVKSTYRKEDGISLDAYLAKGEALIIGGGVRELTADQKASLARDSRESR